MTSHGPPCAGLPVKHLVVATNSNDILARFFKDGQYDKYPVLQVSTKRTKPTLYTPSVCEQGLLCSHCVCRSLEGLINLMQTFSPSMDIGISSNFERYLFYLFNEDR